MDNTMIGTWIRRFLMEHVIGERNLTQNTQASYRDTFVLLLPFVAHKRKKTIEKLRVTDLDLETIRSFLQHLEVDRKCCIATRNQRLATIRVFAHFVGSLSPEHIMWAAKIRSIPFKRTTTEVIGYLEKLEMDAILDTPDRTTPQGRRDYAILLFLYNTGARASEVANVKIADLTLEDFPSVKFIGKGRKVRYCPLWELTIETIRPLIEGRAPKEPVFLNRCRQAITRFGIYFLVERSVSRASQMVSSLRKKPVSVHSIRHTTAVHLLRSGVDINTIRAWLGHVSLDTTHIYAQVDLEMKAKALRHCEIIGTRKKEHWQNNPKVMEFLKALCG